jgi:Reverse transcriptase (RNA-dependent DNA polymerase)/Endonuclease-reverse transcriptase
MAVLKVVTWNAQSIRDKKLEFFDFLVTEEVDVALVSETWLQPNIHFTHADFMAYRLDREDDYHGGVAIFIRRTLKHELLPAFNTQVIESIGIKISTQSGVMNLVSCYFPGSNNSRVLRSFKHDLETLTSLGGSFLLAGDFNSRHQHWGCVRANRAGPILFNHMLQSDYSIFHPPSPTYFPPQEGYTPSVLDIVISNGLRSITNIETIDALVSDHVPVYFEVGCEVLTVPIHHIPCYKNANWNQYRQILHESTNLEQMSASSFDSTDQIDEAIENLTSQIVYADSVAVPRVQPNRFRMILSDELRELIQFRNNRRRPTRNSSDPIIKLAVKSLNRRIQTAVSSFHSENWNSKLQTFRTSDNKFWKLSKLIKNRGKSIPTLKHNGLTLTTEQEKVDVIAESFKRAHHLTVNQVSRHEEEVESCVRSLSTESFLNDDPSTYTRPSEISAILRLLRNGKAPGLDGINNRHLKNLPRRVIVYLTHIFNNCLRLGYFPKRWKYAKVVAIPKPNKDTTDPTNYRPISLLSALGKIFERIILSRLNDHTIDNNIIPNEQFGFAPGLSTSHQLFRIVTRIRRKLADGQSTGMVFFDSEKAFDSVWHGGLIYKLFGFGYPRYIQHIIYSFLTDRSFQVFINKTFSSQNNIPAGVPQGSVLSPSLYNIFNSDIPAHNETECAFYADDTAIFSSAAFAETVTGSLQQHTDSLMRYFGDWKIKINSSKTEAIYFSRRRAPRFLPDTQISVNGVSVPWASKVKYLGLILDKKLLFDKHIEQILHKNSKLIKMYYPFINRKSRLNKSVKLTLFKTIFRAAMLYASPAWTGCAASHKRRLQVAQNKVLKMILRKPWWFGTNDLHDEAGLTTVVDQTDLIHRNFVTKLRFSQNPLVTSLANS